MNQPPKVHRRKGPKLTELSVVAEQAQEYGITPLPQLKGLDRFLTPNQAGRLLHVTGEAVKQWIYNGRLPATKLSNGYWMIQAADLDAFIRARQEYDRKRVLLLCSDESDRDTLCSVLKNVGHEPVETHNLVDAVLKTADLKPSAFIIETNYPGQAGWKLLERIRSMSHARRITVVLVAPSQLSEADEDRALEMRAQAILRSPIDAKQTEMELRSILETARV